MCNRCSSLKPEDMKTIKEVHQRTDSPKVSDVANERTVSTNTIPSLINLIINNTQTN